MSATIPSPPRRDAELDQSAECHAALDFEFRALVTKAQAAGWSEDDVAIALLELVNEHVDRVALKKQLLARVIGPAANDEERES